MGAGILDRTDADLVAMAPDLLRELGEKIEGPPELLAVVRRPADDLSRIPVDQNFLGVVFDRPTSPGNIGTLARSADAFGASGVIVTGHAADVYDPKAIRASTGSLFAVPVVRATSHKEVLDWVQAQRARLGISLDIVGADEKADLDVYSNDFQRPTLLLVGNEAVGLSAGWREACDRMVRIPMSGSASSLNAAASATVLLYEAARQRAAVGRAHQAAGDGHVRLAAVCGPDARAAPPPSPRLRGANAGERRQRNEVAYGS